MSFWDHLEELRWTLLRSVIAVCVFCVAGLLFREPLFDVVLWPSKPDFIVYKWLGWNLNMSLINVEISAQFFTHLKAALAAGVVLAFLIFRRIMHALLPGRRLRLDSDSTRALTRGILNYFICFAILMMLSISILYMFKASDEAIRLVISVELAALWLLSAVREGQILQQKCGGFTTFLYLCGLEFLPAGALVASALIL